MYQNAFDEKIIEILKRSYIFLLLKRLQQMFQLTCKGRDNNKEVTNECPGTSTLYQLFVRWVLL